MVINKNKRLLTVGYLMGDLVPYQTPENKTLYCYHDRPFIRLGGKWLQNAGFSAGDIIEVDVKDNCLVIRKTQNSWKEFGEIKQMMVNESGEPVQKD